MLVRKRQWAEHHPSQWAAPNPRWESTPLPVAWNWGWYRQKAEGKISVISASCEKTPSLARDNSRMSSYCPSACPLACLLLAHAPQLPAG